MAFLLFIALFAAYTFYMNLIKVYVWFAMLTKLHPLAKKIIILLLLKVSILWIFFKIVPGEKIKLTPNTIEHHFLTTQKESTFHDES